MTLTIKDLTALLDRVRAATKGDREIDDAIHIMAYPQLASLPRSWSGGWEHPEHGSIRQSDRYTDSIDSAVALAERVLPVEPWKVSSNFEEAADEAEPAYWARMRSPRLHFAATPALALLAAVLSALIAKESK